MREPTETRSRLPLSGYFRQVAAQTGHEPHHRASTTAQLLRPATSAPTSASSCLLVAAFAATGASIAVPLVVHRVVDGPVATTTGRAAALGGLALLLGLVEALLIFIRRWTQTVCALGMEATSATISTRICSDSRSRSTTGGSPDSFCPASSVTCR